MNRMRRAATAAVLAALVMPIVRNHDSFPLSTYPMYARQRDDVVVLPTAVGVTADGERERLGLDVIGMSDDPLIVGALLRQTARLGEGSLRVLCDDIAARAANRDVDASIIEVIEERHDVVARAQGHESLASTTVLTTCEVPST